MRYVRLGLAAPALALALASAASFAQTAARPAPVANPYDYFGGLAFDPGVPTPESILGFRIGERFARHHQIVDYIAKLAAASDRVKVEEYGRSHQGRSLHILTISSPRNLRRLDEILARNAELTRPGDLTEARRDEIVRDNPAVVWLSFNVHGNEASCSDTALQVAYTLAAGTNREIEGILEKLVVVVDPLLNPDGRERYTSWFENAMSANGPNPDPAAAEHDEPWPGGRSNHYLFDLNRDWLWMVHPESASRIAAYTRYLPQLHIDYHEQEANAPYFFGAGEDPYNAHISPETRQWLDIYTQANSEVFDREGRVYSTRERFDYLYPGYGKVLPTYHGAVGLLTEKGGHGRAGLAIKLSERHTLTLEERIRDHFLTAMNYLETTAKTRAEQLERFARFFKESMTVPDGAVRAFVIFPDNDPAMLDKARRLLEAHRIEILQTTASTPVEGLRNFRAGDDLGRVDLPSGAWIIRTEQPRGRLVRALFERSTEVSDPETYDITGWSLPTVFGLRAAWTTQPIRAQIQPLNWSAPAPAVSGEGDYALIVSAAQRSWPSALGAMERLGFEGRFAGGPFEADGRLFPRGSLIIHSAANGGLDLDGLARELVALGASVHRVSSGATASGYVIGANDNRRLTAPKILLGRGAPTSSLSAGELWHTLDIAMPAPHTPVNIDALTRVDLSEYNVLVLPDASEGGLTSTLGDRGAARIRDWVRAGGTLVAVGGSSRWASRAVLEHKDKEEAKPEDDRPKASELTFEERRKRRIDDNVPGPMLRAEVDVTHPLAAGMREWVGVIKESGDVIPLADEGYAVARFAEKPFIGGLASERSLGKIARTPFMAHHALGAGNVITFSDDPAKRGFTHATMRLFMNAVTLGPSL